VRFTFSNGLESFKKSNVDNGLIVLVRRQFMNDRQREEVIDYLMNRPRSMSGYVRGIRMSARQLDFNQIREDLNLLEELANLEVPTGRKSSNYTELPAKMILRRSASSDAKAIMKVKHK